MRLTHLTWPEVDALDRETPIVVPMAGLVQGGRHLAIGAFHALMEAAVEEIDDQCPEALVLPTLCAGMYERHLTFPGTIAHTFETVDGLLSGTVESLHRHGFRRFMFLHDIPDNEGPVRLVARRLRAKHPSLRITLHTLQAMPGHGGMFDTNNVLALRPELVRPEEMRTDGLEDPILNGVNSMEEISETGIVGHPQDHGQAESLFGWTDEIGTLVEEIRALGKDEPFLGIPAA